MALSHISLKSAWGSKCVAANDGTLYSHTLCNTFKRYKYSPFRLCLCIDTHLEFCNCVVFIVYNLVFHGAEVHRMLDYCWVTRSNRIRNWKREESMGVFPGKTSDTPSVLLSAATTALNNQSSKEYCFRKPHACASFTVINTHIVIRRKIHGL